MKKKIGLVLIILSFNLGLISNAQIIDNYGFRIGTGLSNEYHKLKNSKQARYSGWKNNKPSMAFYLNCEKYINKNFSIRPEIGYLQRGMIDNIITFTDNSGSSIGTYKPSFTLHNLSVNLTTKFFPFQTKPRPYLFAGFRGDFLLGYNDYYINLLGNKIGIYKNTLDDYKKVALSGLIGIGLSFNEKIYLEMEFNPAITKNVNASWISIKSRFIGISIGLNINQIIKKKKK